MGTSWEIPLHKLSGLLDSVVQRGDGQITRRVCSAVLLRGAAAPIP